MKLWQNLKPTRYHLISFDFRQWRCCAAKFFSACLWHNWRTSFDVTVETHNDVTAFIKNKIISFTSGSKADVNRFWSFSASYYRFIHLNGSGVRFISDSFYRHQNVRTYYSSATNCGCGDARNVPPHGFFFDEIHFWQMSTICTIYILHGNENFLIQFAWFMFTHKFVMHVCTVRCTLVRQRAWYTRSCNITCKLNKQQNLFSFQLWLASGTNMFFGAFGSSKDRFHIRGKQRRWREDEIKWISIH